MEERLCLLNLLALSCKGLHIQWRTGSGFRMTLTGRGNGLGKEQVTEGGCMRFYTLLNNQQQKTRMERYGSDRSFTENQQQTLWYLNLQQEAYRLFVSLLLEVLDNTSKKVRKVAWSHRLPGSLPSVEFPITQELQGEIWTNASHEWFAYQWSWMRQSNGLQDLLHLFQLYISTDLWARPIVGQLHCCTGDSSRGTGEGGTPSSSKAWRWPRGLRSGTARGTVNLVMVTAEQAWWICQ